MPLNALVLLAKMLDLLKKASGINSRLKKSHLGEIHPNYAIFIIIKIKCFNVKSMQQEMRMKSYHGE